MLRTALERALAHAEEGPPKPPSVRHAYPTEALTQYWTEQRLREERRAQSALKQSTQTTAFVIAATAVVFLAAACWFALYCLEPVLPHGARFAAALVMLAACQFATGRLRRRANVRVTELLLFGCCLLFTMGALTLIIGEQVSVSSTTVFRADRMIVAGLLPLVLLADAGLVYLAFALALAVCGYVELELFGAAFDPLRLFYLLPFGLIPGFVWGYRQKAGLVVGTQVVLLALWLLSAPLHWQPENYSAFVSLCLGVTSLFMAECHRPGDTLGVAWRLPGLALVGIPLSFLGGYDLWEFLGHPIAGSSPQPDLLAPCLVCETFLSLMLLVAFLVILRLWLQRRDAEQPPRAAFAALARQLWFPIGIGLLAAFLTLWHCSPQSWLGWGLTPVVVSNAASLVLAVYLMDQGVRASRGISSRPASSAQHAASPVAHRLDRRS